MSVNSKLREVHDVYEKAYFEQILKEVCNYLLVQISNGGVDSTKLMSEIISGMETASALNGYNFEALIALLQLNKKSSRYVGSQFNACFYYEWNASRNDLDELIQTLKSEYWIKSTKHFKKLFTKHNDDNLRIVFCKEKVPDLLALFDVLKSRRLIKPKGCKGHFYPLKRYLVDLENKFVFEGDPKTIKTVAKRNIENWTERINIANSWTSGFRSPRLTKLPSSR